MTAFQGTVILAEDEPLVRLAAADSLTQAGYEVVEAAHAGEVLEALRRREGQVLALFTDVHMPGGCNGIELARLVHERWPRIAVLVVSGLHRSEGDELPPGGMFVTKPYNPDKIVEHIKGLTREP